METASGSRINLIMIGAKCPNNSNILLDEPIKYAGFVVDDIEKLQEWLQTNQVAITEGPRQFVPRRTTLFIRDPDGNVLEFNQLV